MILKSKPQRSIVVFFLTGMAIGLAIYHGMLVFTDKTVIKRSLLEEQQAEFRILRNENLELTDDLFLREYTNGIDFSQVALPYNANADAAAMLNAARSTAIAEQKFLMVSFGANWCVDCRTLHYHLNTEPVASYVFDYFHVINVDVGKFNRNRDVAESLGVSLNRGIPVAVFFDQEGKSIGTTNDGQLESSRLYSSKQILMFMRDIADRNRIRKPDSIN